MAKNIKPIPRPPLNVIHKEKRLSCAPRIACFRRPQGGGGMMFWAGIIRDELCGPFRVPETYTAFLDDHLSALLDDLPCHVASRGPSAFWTFFFSIDSRVLKFWTDV